MVNLPENSVQSLLFNSNDAELLIKNNHVDVNKNYEFDNIVFGYINDGVKNISIKNYGNIDLQPEMVIMGTTKFSAYVELSKTKILEPATCFTLEISKEKVWKILDKINEEFSMPKLVKQDKELSDIDIYCGNGGKYVLSALKQIQYLMSEDIRYKDYWLGLKIEELILCCLQSNMHDALVHSYKENCSIDHPLAYAISYIKENLSMSIDMNILADKACMSKSTFFRQFKLHFGITPNKYIHMQRIEKAKKLLEKRKLSVSEIAYKLGYSSPSYFTAQFERIVSSSPTNYRKLKLYQNQKMLKV